MGTKIGIVYGTKSKIIRHIIVPDDDAELNDSALTKNGESILIADRAIDYNLNTISTIVAIHTGVKPPSSRCAVIDANNHVVSIIHADPVLDHMDGHTLHLDEYAVIGWKFNPKTNICYKP